MTTLDTLYWLDVLKPGVYEVSDRSFLMQDALKKLGDSGDLVRKRAWVRINGKFHRKTILQCVDWPYAYRLITKSSIENDEKVIDIREAAPLMPEEGLVSELAQRIGHNYAVMWIERKARYLKLEKDWPELDWFFEGIREDREMAGTYAQSDEKTPVVRGGIVVELGEYRRNRRRCGE